MIRWGFGDPMSPETTQCSARNRVISSEQIKRSCSSACFLLVFGQRWEKMFAFHLSRVNKAAGAFLVKNYTLSCDSLFPPLLPLPPECSLVLPSLDSPSTLLPLSSLRCELGELITRQRQRGGSSSPFPHVISSDKTLPSRCPAGENIFK